jgi:CRISPR/Cas system-associated exonuclease Cas4 (RecB family)
MVFGNAVHACIDEMFKKNEFALTVWKVEWPSILNKTFASRNIILDTGELKRYISKGNKQLAYIHKWLQSKQALKPTQTELSITQAYQAKQFKIVIDIILPEPDYTLLGDWKTGKEKEAHIKQLITYAVFYNKYTGVKNLKGFLSYPAYNKTVMVPFKREDCVAVFKDINTIYNNILTDSTWEPKENEWCSKCSLIKQCKIWG